MSLSVIDAIAIVIFSLLLVLTISSTIYDLYTEINLYKPTALFLAFSLHRNVRDLLKIEPPSSKTIECFYGLRALAAFWVIAGHRLWKLSMLSEPLKYTGLFSEFVIKALWNNRYAAEVFFLMAGILVTLSTLKALDDGRYGRYVPTLAAILLFFASSLPTLLVDNDSDHFLQLTSEPCRKYWWSSLLLVQTYVNPTDLCMGPTWYLCADFHLFVLSPAFIFLVWKLKYKAFWLFAFVILATHLGIFFGRYYDTVSEEFVYYQTHYRIGQFLVGIALGYIMYERKGKRHMRKKMQFIGWTVSILVFALIEIIHTVYEGQLFTIFAFRQSSYLIFH